MTPQDVLADIQAAMADLLKGEDTIRTVEVRTVARAVQSLATLLASQIANGDSV